MYILGIWDGHDSGAALIDDKSVVYAANEERFTKRKLEIEFPYHSIAAALKYAHIKPTDIEHIAYTTTELTKTIERIVPNMKENYYKFRRRKISQPSFEHLRRKIKYNMTTIGPLPLCRAISSFAISRRLRSMGFSNFKLHAVEHHAAHAASAAYTSGLNKGLVITMDGLGDGLSGTASILSDGKLERVASIRARDSIGILYEQVTNLVGMRELEDECKVMAMADFSYPFEFKDNQLGNFFDLTGTHLHARYSPSKQYDMLRSIGWRLPREQFGYMAQQLIEGIMVKLISNYVDRHNIHDIAVAGGLFSNVKMNMLVRGLDNVNSMYIFPHMGDGGIALGAALHAANEISGRSSFGFSAYLGNSYTEDETEAEIKKERAFVHERVGLKESAKHAAELISDGNYLMWFNGRMEYGPRALGDRSILATSESESVKERLNLYVKRREWFQPFAPSVLESDVNSIFDYDGKGYDRYMTSAYMMKKDLQNIEKSVIHVDGTARPQMVGKENPVYMDMLAHVRKLTGRGIVLNTSFNIHGMPIVMDVHDAVETMKYTATKYMFINGIFVTNRKGI
jgi:carbamoyltransferase